MNSVTQPQSWCRLARAPLRQFAFWKHPPAPPFTDFSLIVTPQASSEAYTHLDIPSHILRPDYVTSGGKVEQDKLPRRPVTWSQAEIASIRRSCQIARRVLTQLSQRIEPGVTTDKLDILARDLMIENNSYPSLLNFEGFPKCISSSVNNVAAHGVPDCRALVEGDILNIDVTIYHEGYHGDVSDTFTVGKVDNHADKLIRVTKECLDLGIQSCRPGSWLRSIGHAIHKHAKKEGLSTVPLFLGHGIGSFLHGPPDIYHCLNNYPLKMVPGMVFTIEPVIAEGDWRVRMLEDGWTHLTQDGGRTAQVEQTVLITETGAEILTS